MVTHNQIIKAFETFCTNHKQINSFYSDQTWNFEAKNNTYPAVIMLPIPSTIQPGMVTLSYIVFITDQLNTNRENLDDIYSDTLLIMQDLISYFNDNDIYDFSISDNPISIEPFEEQLDDILCGWRAYINIELPYTLNTCNIPH